MTGCRVQCASRRDRTCGLLPARLDWYSGTQMEYVAADLHHAWLGLSQSVREQRHDMECVRVCLYLSLDMRRVHFLRKVPYPTFLSHLQVSNVHVYLTYPFVYSCSMLEAMPAGCLVIG